MGGHTGVLSLIYLAGQDEEQGKKYYNVESYRLRRTLAEEGISDLLEVEYGKCRICAEHIYCDYYSYLEGNEELF